MNAFFDWLRLRMGWWNSGPAGATPTAPKIYDNLDFVKTVTDSVSFTKTVTDTLNIGESS